LAKRNWNDRQIANATNESKAVWQIIDVNNGKDPGSTVRDIHKAINGSTITSPLETANTLNAHFNGAVNELIKGRADTVEATATKAKEINQIVFLTPIAPKEFYQIIDKITKKKSAGIDDIPCFLLKYIATFIMLPLSNIINESFLQVVFTTEKLLTHRNPVFTITRVCESNKRISGKAWCF
jgi:hypothetical protein